MGKRILLPIDWAERLRHKNGGRPKGAQDAVPRSRTSFNPGPEKKIINRPPAVYSNQSYREKYGL